MGGWAQAAKLAVFMNETLTQAEENACFEEVCFHANAAKASTCKRVQILQILEKH